MVLLNESMQNASKWYCFKWKFIGDQITYTNFLYFVITAKILPVVKNQHLLLCTLLICNAAAMEVYYWDLLSKVFSYVHNVSQKIR